MQSCVVNVRILDWLIMGVNTTLLHGARQALLHAEDALEQAGESEMAFRVGLMADEIGERIDEILDDGSLT